MFCAFCTVTAALAVWAASDAGPPGPPPSFRDGFGGFEAVSRQVDSGFVVLRGRSLAPPYVLESRGPQLLVSGEPVPRPFAQAPFGRASGPRGPWPPGPGWPVEWVASRLEGGGTFMVLEGGRVCLLDPGQSRQAFECLLSDRSSDEKVRDLAGIGAPWMDARQWARVVETFQPDPGLPSRVAELDERLKARESPSVEYAADAETGREWKTLVATAGGMVLTVAALGALLNCPIRRNRRWRDVDRSPRALRLVVVCSVLLVLLGLFDLACTQMAGGSAGFVELNPLGRSLAHDGTALAAFKIGTLAGAAGLLLALRRYHGAQVAAWWLCLTCTVLAFRWVTFNSMFLL